MIIALTAMVLSIEIVLAVCALLSHVPIAVDLSFVHSIVPCYQRTFQHRGIYFYTVYG